EDGFVFQNDLYIYSEIKEKKEKSQREIFNATVATLALGNASMYYFCIIFVFQLPFLIFLVGSIFFVAIKIIILSLKKNTNRKIAAR
ncbi:MAG: hypothetical protein ACRCSK_02660, partial [Fusobacteriaceae bacterium]